MYFPECLRGPCLVPSYSYFTLTPDINNISTAINSYMRLFTDDSLMYHEIKSPADHLTLQDDIKKLHEWAERWQMNFNVTKCAVMSLSTQKLLQHDYIMNAQLIPRVQKHNYLGITISSCLTWKDQCTKVGNNAGQTPPPLEYVTCTWSPHTQNDKQCLENLNIQQAAARFVCSDYGKRSSVTQMIDQLGWDRLAGNQTAMQGCHHALHCRAQQGWHPRAPTRLYRQRYQ